MKKKCDPYIKVYLFATQLLIVVLVDFLEDIGGWWAVANVDEFHIEEQRGLGWDDIASTAIAIAQRWRNGEFTFFTWNLKENKYTD